ncbi:hypothetical protein E2C01_099683 [Portunus trituberculatus]|uniref:Uncharacterized protein n=1 Tax=Portunus trituberculatus TaxID=210409 RepID=A0A5B7KHG4_PORTR|nr:hypothetical protein [Portunus trituberculatus]
MHSFSSHTLLTSLHRHSPPVPPPFQPPTPSFPPVTPPARHAVTYSQGRRTAAATEHCTNVV